MSEFDVVMLYFCVGAVLAGLVIALGYAISLKGRGKDDRLNMIWAPPGLGKTEYMLTPAQAGWFDVLEDVSWYYVDAHDSSREIRFDDPYEAKDYVVAAIKEKQAQIERMENTQWRGLPTNYDWIYIDAHMDREYWMDQLKDFKEDW